MAYKKLKKVSWPLIVFLVLLNFGIWVTLSCPHKVGFVLQVMDVGQGDATFIQTAGGRQVLIDGGPDSKVLQDLNKVMPAQDRSLDLVVLTHPHSDHMTGLFEVLRRYRVAEVIDLPVPNQVNSLTRQWDELIASHHIFRVKARTGDRYELGDGSYLEFFAPTPLVTDLNNDSVVTTLHDASHCEMLLAGDMGFPEETQLLASGEDIHCDGLKVGHHGSATSSSVEFLQRVEPRLAAISVGQGNSYGHPNPDTLKRLTGITVWRTDLVGTVTLERSANGTLERQ